MSTFADSRAKSKLIMKIAKVDAKLANNYSDALNNKRDDLVKQLWDVMNRFPQLEEVITKHGYSVDEFNLDSKRMVLAGLGWEVGEYAPLSILCFASPLDYFLNKKTGKEGFNELKDLAFECLVILKSM